MNQQTSQQPQLQATRCFNPNRGGGGRGGRGHYNRPSYNQANNGQQSYQHKQINGQSNYRFQNRNFPNGNFPNGNSSIPHLSNVLGPMLPMAIPNQVQIPLNSPPAFEENTGLLPAPVDHQIQNRANWQQPAMALPNSNGLVEPNIMEMANANDNGGNLPFSQQLMQQFPPLPPANFYPMLPPGHNGYYFPPNQYYQAMPPNGYGYGMLQGPQFVPNLYPQNGNLYNPQTLCSNCRCQIAVERADMSTMTSDTGAANLSASVE